MIRNKNRTEKVQITNYNPNMSREEVNELIYYISQLKHQYNLKIDEQSEKINEQNTVIEELLWQLRELSDKVRRLTDNVKNLETQVNESEKNNEICCCRYENHTLHSNKSIRGNKILEGT